MSEQTCKCRVDVFQCKQEADDWCLHHPLVTLYLCCDSCARLHHCTARGHKRQVHGDHLHSCTMKHLLSPSPPPPFPSLYSRWWYRWQRWWWLVNAFLCVGNGFCWCFSQYYCLASISTPHIRSEHSSIILLRLLCFISFFEIQIILIIRRCLIPSANGIHYHERLDSINGDLISRWSEPSSASLHTKEFLNKITFAAQVIVSMRATSEGIVRGFDRQKKLLITIIVRELI